MNPSDIPYPGEALPPKLRRIYRMLAVVWRARSISLMIAALGFGRRDRVEFELEGTRYSLRTRPLRELRIDIGIVWEVCVCRAYPLPPDHTDLTIVDIGAHRGHFTVWAARQRPGAVIDAYEPDPGNAQELREALRINDCTGRVTVYEEAVAAEAGIRRFLAGPRSDGGHLTDDAGDEVSAVDLPTVLDRCRTGRVYLKMDAEGTEHEAFAALSRETLASAAVDTIILEWHPPPGSARDVRESLKALGFSVNFRLLDDGAYGMLHARPSEPRRAVS